MSRWNDLSPAVQTVIALAMGGGAYVVVRILGGVLFEDGSTGRVVFYVVLGLVGVALVAVELFVVRTRLGGRGQLKLFRRAFRTGEVPEGAKTETWRPQIERVQGQAKVFRKVAVAGMVGAGVFVVVAVLVALLWDGDAKLSLFLVLLAVGLLGANALGYWIHGRNRRNADRLLERIDG